MAAFAAAPSHAAQFQPPTHQQLYGYGGQYSPMNSTPTTPTTPTNVSPTSSRTSPPEWSHHNLFTRQLRPPRNLLYVPAVLRPTEKPLKNSPPKDGRAGSSGDDGSAEGRERRATVEGVASGLSNVVANEFIEGPFCEVTGPPITDHWKPDSAASQCEYSVCDITFIWPLNRRHHCRRCGGIFCQEHSKREVPLDQRARFHPDAPKWRVCDTCYSDWMTWETARIGRSNSAGSSDNLRSAAMQVGGNLASPRAGITPTAFQRVGSLAGSVPNNWSWSTF